LEVKVKKSIGLIHANHVSIPRLGQGFVSGVENGDIREVAGV
jgi:hypothetical protein